MLYKQTIKHSLSNITVYIFHYHSSRCWYEVYAEICEHTGNYMQLHNLQEYLCEYNICI
jgi:hypothetical protein